MNDLNTLLFAFASLFKEQVIFFAQQYKNTKSKNDTLSHSDIVNNMDVLITNDNKLEVFIYNYFVFIESGRKKGARGVPPEAILDWIKRKRLKGRDKTTGKFISNDAFVWLIINAIKRDGISPRPIFTKAFQTSYEVFDTKFNETLNKIVDEMIINLLISSTTRKVNTQIQIRKNS